MDKYETIRMIGMSCEGIAAITGLFYWKKWKKTYWKWFPFYLLIITVGECAGKYLREHPTGELYQDLYWFILLPFQYFFLLALFLVYNKTKKQKTTLQLICLLIYACAWMADIFYFKNKVLFFSSFSNVVGDLLFFVLLLAFFYKYVFSERILYFQKDIMFWVSAGILLYYVGTLPLDALYNTLSSKFYQIFETYWFVSMFLDCFMYLIFAFSFIWAKPKYSYSL